MEEWKDGGLEEWGGWPSIILNLSKFEILITKFETISKFQNVNTNGLNLLGKFDIRICLGFRSSIFGFFNHQVINKQIHIFYK